VGQLAQIPQLLVSGITNGCIYAIVAVGFSIIYNSTGVINFAQGEFVMIGAMVAAVLLAKASLLVALPAAVVVGCAVGALLALLILIPLRRASVITLVIITIGASIMFRGLAQLFLGEQAIPVPPFTGVIKGGLTEDRVFHFAGAVIRGQDLWVLGVTAVLVIGMQIFFKYSLVGKAMRACSINATGARLAGISIRRMVVLSFVMAAGLGAVAGVTVSPICCARCTMGVYLGLKGFCAAVLGGLGNFSGGVWGGIILGVVESLVGGLLWSDYKDAVAFLILIAILFIRPEGLLSRRKAEA
jgi:branched-chain amino acid transport system permease protein